MPYFFENIDSYNILIITIYLLQNKLSMRYNLKIPIKLMTTFKGFIVSNGMNWSIFMKFKISFILKLLKENEFHLYFVVSLNLGNC